MVADFDIDDIYFDDEENEDDEEERGWICPECKEGLAQSIEHGGKYCPKCDYQQNQDYLD